MCRKRIGKRDNKKRIGIKKIMVNVAFIFVKMKVDEKARSQWQVAQSRNSREETVSLELTVYIKY